MSGRLRIDVFFDFICPWCLIGKRQLERAQDQLRVQQPCVEIITVWHGVQLLPQLPAQGELFAEFYRKRLGSPEVVAMRQAQVQQAAMDVGLAIDLSRITTMPNTADAHRLLERVSVLGNVELRDALLERLFAAYFQNGEDLGCRETLIAIARSCGVEAGAVSDCLLGDASPFDGFPWATNGVPSFRFDNRLTVVGAQPAEALLDAMCEALLKNAHERQPI
ncbi:MULTISPECIES: DsbA family protein [Gammaproteobacteria]|uniref:DsbA family protein n=1 Tax=Gammaproteobacteria TaxID=1236 RepID=UPI001912DAD5|nr:DsbA family oxidoreductase [Bacillus sp. TH86]MBK5309451.1 DsbA family oxidoreductase [Pseudomonas sp. TH71]MBK5314913.1 DsbA family oxidoreductase [Erwinia sp. TH79]MBK5320414.1 DsbA family oxidoreductase [Bacillus sp. TH59]MBK5335364.1 DsbA family oxidoreductase [Bacillus sp. TH57]MBK5368655.1 DsbA family oxidoreductase [Pseudomonas sp. TH40]MBK5379824.1 DsbA family oxidoreductase [Pseudomonas sp. TH35]MBK5385283.1 DsbA family oxidoreductase [Pseudomonas sp. TH38]MBK5402578.1 DsbA fami